MSRGRAEPQQHPGPGLCARAPLERPPRTLGAGGPTNGVRAPAPGRPGPSAHTSRDNSVLRPGPLRSSDRWNATGERSAHAVRYKGEILGRKVPFRVVVLAWDGRAFRVAVKKGTLEAGAKQAAIE